MKQRMKVARRGVVTGAEGEEGVGEGKKKLKIVEVTVHRMMRAPRMGRLERKTFHWWSLVSCESEVGQTMAQRNGEHDHAQLSIQTSILSTADVRRAGSWGASLRRRRGQGSCQQMQVSRHHLL